MNTHLIHGIIALVLMVAGWSALTYFLLRSTHGRRERRFVLRAILVCSICIIAVATLIRGYLPGFGAIMFFAFLLLRRRQLVIRRQEEANA